MLLYLWVWFCLIFNRDKLGILQLRPALSISLAQSSQGFMLDKCAWSCRSIEQDFWRKEAWTRIKVWGNSRPRASGRAVSVTQNPDLAWWEWPCVVARAWGLTRGLSLWSMFCASGASIKDTDCGVSGRSKMWPIYHLVWANAKSRSYCSLCIPQFYLFLHLSCMLILCTEDIRLVRKRVRR